MVAAPGETPPGWHGKLPTLGDFASRRLTPAFLATWDGWLAAGMQQLRERDSANWLETYLAAPSQRFLLMPGVLPGEAGLQAWAGILMPSVDRVGRYFPFTIVQSVAVLPASLQQMQALWSWLARLDELAADALHDDWQIDRLEAELARMSGPGPLSALPAGEPSPGAPGALIRRSLPSGLDVAQLLAVDAQALWQRHAQGLAYWHSSTDQQPPGLRVSRGLPASAADLLGVTI
jgi:type VI secretion system protein ImpM